VPGLDPRHYRQPATEGGPLRIQGKLSSKHPNINEWDQGEHQSQLDGGDNEDTFE